ncbi:serine protease FAM111A-like [Engraulis encrasicolus]|uniref:serine protease FAM111A-like n=1 Tax=Engraulis encrasicolus TaxID=184585 RepID=UPI002FD3F6F3
MNMKPTSFKVKEENVQESMSQHAHTFKVKFDPSDQNDYTIYCDHPQTVLEAVKSQKKELKSPDEDIIFQLGREDKDVIIPTHFPCCLVGHEETVILSCQTKMIEKAQNQQHKMFHPNDKYSIFYIDTVGGTNAKSKELFQNKIVKKYKRLCVYGEEGMTVADVLRRDGRFSDHLGDFTLSDNDNPNSLTSCTQKVNDSLDQKTFKIQLQRRKSDVSVHESPSKTEQCKGKERSAADIAQQCGDSLRTLMEKQGDEVDTTEIYDILRKQFPELRKWMENRFPADSYQKELELRKENFGKSQKSFSEVHRVRKLLKLGESVCKITVGDICEGTGFVLFDGFILTNAHLFTDHVDEDKKLEEGIEVYALFNYEDPQPKNVYYFMAEKRLVDFDRNLDYAILELNKCKGATRSP